MRAGSLTAPFDLAIEALSPDDRPAEVQAKVAEYLACGTQLVIAIDADRRTVTTYAHGASSTTLGSGDQVLDLSAVLPGFDCRLSDIFESASLWPWALTRADPGILL